MKEKPKKEDFILKKCILKKGVVMVHYRTKYAVNGQEHSPKSEDKISHPHHDLLGLIEALKPYLTSSWGFIGPVDGCQATGIDISGDDQFRGAIITGVKETVTANAAMNSPRITFEGTTFGFEADLDNLVASISSEIYEGLFTGKASQMEMFGDGENTDQDGEG